MQPRPRFYPFLVLCFLFVAAACSDDSSGSGKDGGQDLNIVSDKGPPSELGTDTSKPPTDGTTGDKPTTTTAGGKYVYLTKAGDLLALSLKDCTTQTLHSFTTADMPPTGHISPDGQWFFVFKNPGVDGYALNLTTKSAVTLTKPGGGMVAWSQDSTMLVTGYGFYANGMVYQLPSGKALLSSGVKLSFPSLLDAGKTLFYIDPDLKEARRMDLSTQQPKTLLSGCYAVSASHSGDMMCYLKTTSSNTVKWIDSQGTVTKTLELGSFKQYSAQSPQLTWDGKRLIYGEADTQNLITIYALELATQKKTKVAEELGATGTYFDISWDSQAVAFASQIGQVQTGKTLCTIDLNQSRLGAGFIK